MSDINNEFCFKGDDFRNLYRIEVVLTSISPMHIGTGQSHPDASLSDHDPKDNEGPMVSEIERAYDDLPYIPGSALKGVIRSYLYQMFSSFSSKLASSPEYDKDERMRSFSQKEQENYMRTEASLLEQLFGTPFSESKIEFWDAHLLNRCETDKFQNKGWFPQKQSFVLRSVAIDPLTGAAAPNKLYSFEVTPPGLSYQMTIVGRNLSEQELGFLLLGIEGFNSCIAPIHVGAMSGRGFGKMQFNKINLYRLTRDDFPNWLNIAAHSNCAGYELLKNLSLSEETQKILIKKFKSAFISSFEENM